MLKIGVTNEVVHQMASGTGASWHALLHPTLGHGGSAFGGTPPVLPQYENLWQSLEQHAAWLGLKFIRAEIDWKCWLPQRGEPIWDSPEMRILDRILDWAQNHGSDVMLQCMWPDVDWLAFPEYRDDLALRQVSAPSNLPAFAQSWVLLLQKLIHQRGYTCIKWINIVNEPNYYWWLVPPDTRESRNFQAQANYLASALKAVRAALNQAEISVKLMGPDYTDLPIIEDLTTKPWWPYVDDVDFHSYNSCFDWEDPSTLVSQAAYPIGERLRATLIPYREQTQQAGRGLYLTEYGTQTYGFKADDPAPGSFKASLKDTELFIRALNLGIDGMNHWSFTNRGDLDGQWQFVDTWDRQWKLWLEDAHPHEASYYVLGQANRHLPHRAKLLNTALQGELIGGLQRVFAASARSPRDGSISVFMVNDSTEPLPTSLTWNFPERPPLYRLVASQDPATSSGTNYERLDLQEGHYSFVMPAQSLVILTDSPLSPESPGRF